MKAKLVAAALCLLAPELAFAQTNVVAPILPDHYSINPGGVDMRSGRLVYSRTELSIGGEGDDGLALIREFDGAYGHVQPFGTLFRHNWEISLVETRVEVEEAGQPSEYDFQVSVKYGGLASSFRSHYAPDDVYYEVSTSDRSILLYTGSRQAPKATIYTYTSYDGTVITFRQTTNSGAGNDCTTFPGTCVFASSVTKPNGTRYDFEYDFVGAAGQDRARLRSVVSNRGYALLFEYPTPTSKYVTKACALNLAVTAKPSTNICPSASISVKVATFGYTSNNLTSATDANGATETYAYTAPVQPASIAITKPGVGTAFVTNSLAYSAEGVPHVNSQNFADGSSYSYMWNYLIPNASGTYLDIAGGKFTNANGGQVTVTYGVYGLPSSSDPTMFATAGPELVKDELNRSTTATYCISTGGGPDCRHLAQSQTVPEGNSTLYTYDVYRNVTQRQRVAKPGSGIASIAEQRTYNCLITVTCTKPLTYTDGQGNAYTYTYDALHGGVLTETLPAVGGLAPQKRYEYAQRFAWVRNAANTGYEQATTSVWVLVRERSCKTTAASGATCAGGAADEVVSDYDYGPNSGPSNLLLRGVAVTATNSAGVLETQRTCYGYDTNGRRISQTSALANLATCP